MLTGRHHLPVFKGKPSEEMLEALTHDLPEDVIQKQQWTDQNKYVSEAHSAETWPFIDQNKYVSEAHSAETWPFIDQNKYVSEVQSTET